MGAVSGMLGLGGGAGGTGFAGPGSADIVKPVSKEQAQTSYDANQQALAQQQALVQAIQAQNGLGNQSSVYNQLSQIAQGQGPNPALAQLANATGANTANQAALMASQRGTGANPALIARQAAMQGANNQQQAAGQAAALQAQQSLGAIEGMGNLANQQAQQQIGTTQGLTAAQQNEQQNLLNSIAQQNASAVGMQSNINQANAGLAGQTMGMTGSILGGLANAGGGAMFGGAKGGGAKGGAEGGPVNSLPEMPKGPQSAFGQWAASIGSQPKKEMYAEGGEVDALVSPGEVYLDRTAVDEVKKGADPMKAGEKIPGKPKVSGAKNDYANDTVPKKLEEGGIVLPRSVTQSKNPEWEAHKFVRALMANGGLVKSKKDK